MNNLFSDLISDETDVGHALRKLDLINKNPASIQQVSLELLEQYLNREQDIVDATNPFMKLIESSALNTASFIIDNETSTRKQYASCAQTVEDLYLHMSDKDYIDRFASPATTKFYVVVPMKQLLENMVEDPVTRIKKITIPRNSEFILNEYTFSIQYPIDIKQLSHGGIQVVYDTTVESPLEKLTTNVVNHSIKKIKNLEDDVLFMELDVTQFHIKSTKHELSSSKLFRKTIEFSDQYYYARVYFKNNQTNNKWREIQTTHTDQVYDINKPTAVLKVINNKLEVYIPQVYFTNNLVSGSVRVDIYQTLGEINVSLSTFKPSAFKGRWLAIDNDDKTPEVAAWVKLNDTFIYSDKTVYGGKDQLSFESLRQRVMTNAIGDRNIPITNAQIAAHIENKGFDIVKTVDLVTNRVFQATRALPKPFDERLITAAATSMESIIVSMDDIKDHSAVHDNGDRITLSPDLLFQNNNGIINIVPATVVADLMSKTPDLIASTVTDGNYIYTPFHYVLDATDKDFRVRPYYLDKPEFRVMEFVNQNDTTQLQVNTDKFSITRTVYGYQVLIQTKSNNQYKELDDNRVAVQMSFVPEYEASRVYLNGELVTKTNDNERIFKFDIRTNFDIDDQNILYLKSFMMNGSILDNFGVKLTQTFDFFYTTNANMSMTWLPHGIDNLLGNFLLPPNTVGITHEKADFTFGQYLKYLWTSNRTLASSAPFERWDTDVPAVYEEDVFDIDPITGSIFSLGANNQLEYNVKHFSGDPVLDDNGNQVYKYRVGDIKTDSNGEPIPIGPKFVSRQLELIFVEGPYYFSTDPSSTVYRENFVNTLVNWITLDLEKLNQVALEQTEIFFYPKANMSTIQVMVEGGSITLVDANQYFNVRLYVNKQVYENTALSLALTDTTIKTIDEHLKRDTISMSAITSALEKNYGDDVISFSIEGLGGNRNLDALTVLSPGDRCSIRKRLTSLGDGKLIVQEDINVEFVRHDLNQ
jgi:hypothetical protein